MLLPDVARACARGPGTRSRTAWAQAWEYAQSMSRDTQARKITKTGGIMRARPATIRCSANTRQKGQRGQAHGVSEQHAVQAHVRETEVRVRVLVKAISTLETRSIGLVTVPQRPQLHPPDTRGPIATRDQAGGRAPSGAVVARCRFVGSQTAQKLDTRGGGDRRTANAVDARPCAACFTTPPPPRTHCPRGANAPAPNWGK